MLSSSLSASSSCHSCRHHSFVLSKYIVPTFGTISPLHCSSSSIVTVGIRNTNDGIMKIQNRFFGIRRHNCISSSQQQERNHFSHCSTTRNNMNILTQNRLFKNSNNNKKGQSVLYFSSFHRGHDLTAESLLSNPNQDPSIPQHPKIILTGYSSSGFDVMNALKLMEKPTTTTNNNNDDENTITTTTTRNNERTMNPRTLSSSENGEQQQTNNNTNDGTLHMNGNIIAFPSACFLWKHIQQPKDITYESLAVVLLHRPKIDYLFLGYNNNNNNNNHKKNTKKEQQQPRMMLSRSEFIKLHQKMQQEHGIIVEQMSLDNAIGTFNLLNAEDRLVAVALIRDDNDDDDDDEEEKSK